MHTLLSNTTLGRVCGGRRRPARPIVPSPAQRTPRAPAAPTPTCRRAGTGSATRNCRDDWSFPRHARRLSGTRTAAPRPCRVRPARRPVRLSTAERSSDPETGIALLVVPPSIPTPRRSLVDSRLTTDCRFAVDSRLPRSDRTPIRIWRGPDTVMRKCLCPLPEIARNAGLDCRPAQRVRPCR